MDDDKCTLISSNLQTTDFDLWLQKNGVESFVTNNVNSTENCITSLDVDPFLNEICDSTNLDVVSQLECEIMICDSDDNTTCTSPTTNKLLCKQNASFKHEILMNKIPSAISMKIVQEKCIINVKDSEGSTIFLPQVIQVSDTSQVPETDQKITVLNFIALAKDVNIMLPQFVTDCGVKLLLCPLQDCTEAFFHISYAKIHSLKHLRIKPYKCDIPNCPWEFYTPFKLSRHKTTHSKSKNFVCDFKNCNRGFTTIYNLNWHKKNHEKPATLPCPVATCTKIFQTEKDRRCHCKTHNVDDAPFRCSNTNCNKSFFTQTSLQTHARSHSHKESDLCCQYPDCGRSFETPYRLKEHLRSHTGQRPYVCNYDECTWSFTTASKLRRHQSTHTKDRKFHCTIGNCTKSFLRPEHLKDHTLTHIGQRLFECDYCGSNFIGKSSLYVHIRKVHPDKRQQANRCKKRISDKQNSDVLLEQAIQSLGVPSDMMLGSGILPELLENDNFSTVNLKDLD